VVAAGLFLIAGAYTYVSDGSSAALSGITAGLLGMVVQVGSFGVYIPLVKDAGYVRQQSRWRPKWWYYVGGGLAPAIALLFAGPMYLDQSGFLLMILAHPIFAVIVSISYLYKRHKHLAVP
jgi:hypothetical protein